MTSRVYEAISLIQKSWTSHDGPFNWEGEFFHHRQVNIVPRPYQQPHPPIWVTTTSPGSSAQVAERGYTAATMFNGTKACRQVFDLYRETYTKKFGSPPHPDKLAYSGYIFVGESDEEALREALKIQDYLKQSFRSPKGQYDVPGYYDPRLRATVLKEAAETGRLAFTPQDLVKQDPRTLVDVGIGFYGSPDSVFEQLKDFFYGVGGFGNFMGMFQASTMSYALTTKSVRLFSEHVLPRLREEVYEPWLREHGLKQLLLPRSGVEAPNVGVAAGIGSPRAA
jgi:alkanesulfonate monooxygenase SsuD/methylene tetrahydromethanopterin reductase-like flavin-dependent oxidoreductase (luciferase family)